MEHETAAILVLGELRDEVVLRVQKLWEDPPLLRLRLSEEGVLPLWCQYPPGAQSRDFSPPLNLGIRYLGRRFSLGSTVSSEWCERSGSTSVERSWKWNPIL